MPATGTAAAGGTSTAGTGEPLTRSQVEAFTTTHLDSAAEHWTESAKAWEGHFTTIHAGMSRPGGTTWEGPAADQATERSWADLVKVRGCAECLRAAASHARTGSEDVAWAKRQVLATIEEAEDAGFAVGEDLSVTEKLASPLMRVSAARQQQAQNLATEISSQAKRLVAMDKAIAGKITEELAPLAKLNFEEAPAPNGNGAHVQAVDYHFKLSPDPAPAPPPPPPGPSGADIRKVLEQLPKGSQDWIREVRSQAELQKLLEWSTKDGKEVPGRYPDPSKGVWRDLPDGSKIGERYAAKSTGDASLDINLNGEKWKVHINAESGAEPNIPAPKAPVEVPKEQQVEPPKVPQAEPPQAPKAGPGEPGGQTAPIESAPAPKAAPAMEPGPAVEGFGGPSAVPFGPHFIHPPGTINHPFPILGEDDPWENPRDFEGHH